MRACHLLLAAALLSTVLPVPAAAQDTLRVAASAAWNMPYGKIQGDRLVAGIVLDLYAALAQKSGLTLATVVLPRKRIDGAVANGEIDLRCHFNPQWTAQPQAYVWSKPLFTMNDVLFGREGTPALRSLQDIARGTLVSTTLGYRYPSLDALFESGELQRDDSVDEEKVLRKMTVGRTPYGVTNAHALDWYQREVPQHQLASWRLVVDSTPIHCAVPKAGALPAAVLLNALEELRKTGRIDAIVRAYR